MAVMVLNGLVEAGPYYRGNYSPTYSNTYQGYRTPYRNPYQGYGNTYAQQPSYGYGYSNGINYDSYGNSFIGTKDNGIYLLCNGRGCPGRG